MRTRLKGRISAPRLPVVCGCFAAALINLLFARIKQNLALQIQIARVVLLIVDVGVRLAVKELAVNIQPAGGVGRQQGLAVGARSADSVSGQQAGQVQVWPKTGAEKLP